MIGTIFEKPLQFDTLTRTVMRTVTREVEKQEPVYDENGLLIEYKTVTKTVTEEVPEQEEYDNPAPNTMTKYRIAAQWCNANHAVIEDKGEWYEVVALPEPTAEEKIEAAYQALDAAVEARLNAFAATRKYSSINSACSYATSTDAQFRLEGEYCVQARDLTYRTCYNLLAEYMPEVQAGTRSIPTWAEIEPLLPELKWPDEA